MLSSDARSLPSLGLLTIDRCDFNCNIPFVFDVNELYSLQLPGSAHALKPAQSERSAPVMSTHEDFTPRAREKDASDRSFGLVFTAFFAIVALLPVRHAQPMRIWALPVSAVVLLITLIRPSLFHWPNRLWGKLGWLLGRVVGPLVTGLLFYVVVTPIGILLRLLGKDLLRLRWEPQQKTYWIDREPAGPDPQTMVHQF